MAEDLPAPSVGSPEQAREPRFDRALRCVECSAALAATVGVTLVGLTCFAAFFVHLVCPSAAWPKEVGRVVFHATAEVGRAWPVLLALAGLFLFRPLRTFIEEAEHLPFSKRRRQPNPRPKGKREKPG
ncbi:MAG: hypothetical protein L0216_00075 [Planctomycetales bacterium]|nr:hypothetical protein [Planctomycetales bacterium]